MARDRQPTQYAWGKDAMQRSFERDDEIRASRPATRSSSSVPHRCKCCGHWGVKSRDACAACGLPWEPAENIGPAVVSDRIGRAA